jgi:GxxExxY protein
MNADELTSEIIGGAISIHRALGPGLLESAYQKCLVYELTSRGLDVRRELAVPLVYKGLTIETPYRVDILVEGRVVVEVKAVESLQHLHNAQVLTYLRLLNLPLGLLINFNVVRVIEGLKRIVNDPNRTFVTR